MAAIHQIMLALGRAFTFTVTPGADRNFRTLAIAAGWDGNDAVRGTLAGAATASSASTPALTISGLFPNGVQFINNGTITGCNGAAGATGTHGAAGAGGSPGLGWWGFGGAGNSGGGAGAGGAGGAGGLALSVNVPVTVNNLGSIVRGAGGAGGAAGTRSGGGGGGGSGSDNGDPYTPYDVWGGWGGNGYSVAGGGPGAGGASGLGGGFNMGGNGGASGSAGADAPEPIASGRKPGGPGGPGGAAGATGATGANGNAITGNSNITYINTGTRTGTIA